MQFTLLFTCALGAVAARRPILTTSRRATSTSACTATLPTYSCLPETNQAVWQQNMLAQHNSYRARHNSPAMTWNSDLVTVALNNVNNNANQNTFQHTSNPPYGENIGVEYGWDNPEYIGYLWYNETTIYNYNQPGFADSTGHFTQMVWAASTQLGCAFTQQTFNPSASNYLYYYMACEYQPAGNVGGEYSQNVSPPNSQPSPTPEPMYLN